MMSEAVASPVDVESSPLDASGEKDVVDKRTRRSTRLRKRPHLSAPPAPLTAPASPDEQSYSPKKDRTNDFDWKYSEKKALNLALEDHGPDDLMELQRSVPSRNMQEIKDMLEKYKKVARGSPSGYEVNIEANLNKWISAMTEVHSHYKTNASLSCAVNTVMKRKRTMKSADGYNLFKLMRCLLKQEVSAEAIIHMKPVDAKYLLKILNDLEKEANMCRQIVHSDPFFQKEGSSKNTDSDVSHHNPRWKPYHTRTGEISTVNPLGISEKVLKAVDKISSKGTSELEQLQEFVTPNTY